MDKVQQFIEENQHQLGYIMSEASRKWIENDSVGALTVGECNVFVKRHGKYHEVVEKMERFEKALENDRDRNLGLILALEQCKWKAEDVVERGYSEVSDAIAIIDIVKEHTENQ